MNRFLVLWVGMAVGAAAMYAAVKQDQCNGTDLEIVLEQQEREFEKYLGDQEDFINANLRGGQQVMLRNWRGVPPCVAPNDPGVFKPRKPADAVPTRKRCWYCPG